VHTSGYQIKLPGLEADRSPPSSVDIKIEWRCNSSPSIHLCGVSRGNVTFCTCNMYRSELGVILKWSSLLRPNGRAGVEWSGLIWVFVNAVMNREVHEMTGIY